MNLKMSKFSIEHIATLANFALEPAEQKGLEGDIEMIIQMVEKINEVDVTGVEMTTSVNALSNVSRQDQVKESLNIADVLKEAPSANAGYIKVPKVFD